MSRTRWVALVCVVAALLVGCTAGADDEDGADGEGGEGRVSDDPIRIGFLGELSGPFAIWGTSARNGMELAVDDVNAQGGIDGRSVELVERDTQGIPEEAVSALRELVERRDVVAVGGPVSSDVGLAVARVAEEEPIPLFLVMAGADRILGPDSRMTFRTCLPAASRVVDPFVTYIEEQGFTRIGAVAADYEWGRAVEGALRERLDALPDVEYAIEIAPVQEREFTSYLRRFQDLDPQMIIATGHPPGALPLTRQAVELGLDAFVTGSNSPAAAVLEEVGDAAYGRYLDLSCSDHDSEAYQELAARYHERFDTFMEDDAVSGYGQVRVLAETIEAIGSTDPDAIADHLRATTFELPGYAWDLAWSENGDLVDATPNLVTLTEGPPPEGVNPDASWYPEVLFRSPPLEPADS